MTRYEKASKLSEKDFKQIIGVTKETFDVMVSTLQAAYIEKHKRRSGPLPQEQLVTPDNIKYLRGSCEKTMTKEGGLFDEDTKAAVKFAVVFYERTLYIQYSSNRHMKMWRFFMLRSKLIGGFYHVI